MCMCVHIYIYLIKFGGFFWSEFEFLPVNLYNYVCFIFVST